MSLCNLSYNTFVTFSTSTSSIGSLSMLYIKGKNSLEYNFSDGMFSDNCPVACSITLSTGKPEMSQAMSIKSTPCFGSEYSVNAMPVFFIQLVSLFV